MPEEIFDIVEDLFDEAKKRRKKNKKSKKSSKKSREQPQQKPMRADPTPVDQSSSGGLVGRFTRLFQPVPSQPASAAAPALDPDADLDRALQQQLQLLDDVRRSIEEVSVTQRRMHKRSEANSRRAGEFERLAREELANGSEDLARVALERKRLSMAQALEFERELQTLNQELAQLMRAEARLEAKVETFRARRDVLRSQRASAEAQARIGEMYSGLSEESSDVAYTMKRIETHTAELRSRGAATEQMLDDGLVEGVEDPGTRFDRQLEMTAIDDDLARLEDELARERGQS